jgi:hypothetical protein
MQQFDYKVIPAPQKGEKVRGLKTGAERFAHTLSELMNDMARDSWEFLRAETLPAEERTGFTSKAVVQHALLVFRRPHDPDAAEATPKKRGLSAETPEGSAPRLGPAE